MFLKIVCLIGITCLAACDKPPVSTDSEARQFLEMNGIFPSRPCSIMPGPGCVSLGGIRKKTLEGVYLLKIGCKMCSTFRITGGTEPRHSVASPHSRGMAIDFVEAAPTNLEKLLTDVTPPSGGVYRFGIGGYWFRISREGPAPEHWHLEVD